MYSYNKKIKYILVLDIGGTYIKYAIIDSQYKIHFKNKNPNPMKNNFNQLKNVLFNIYKSLRNQFEINGIAISSLGVVNKNNTNIFWSGLDKWKYRNYDFKSIFNNLSIYIENDVNCAIIGEKYFGKWNNIKNLFMITLGTGIGGGIIIDNKLYTGFNNFAGEVGSMIINNKKWEEIASVSAFLKSIPEFLKTYTLNEIIEISKVDKEIFKYIDNWYKNIAIGVINICSIFNPEKFIIGGGVSDNKNFDINRIKYHISRLIPNNNYLINYYTIQRASLGNDAALYGAAYLYFQNRY